MTKSIQPTRITLDTDGNWKHPDLPPELFYLPSPEATYWLQNNHYHSKVLHIGSRVEQAKINRWLNRESLPEDNWPQEYNHRGFIVIAITQAEEELLVWMIKPKEGAMFYENQDAA